MKQWVTDEDGDVQLQKNNTKTICGEDQKYLKFDEKNPSICERNLIEI